MFKLECMKEIELSNKSDILTYVNRMYLPQFFIRTWDRLRSVYLGIVGNFKMYLFWGERIDSNLPMILLIK